MAAQTQSINSNTHSATWSEDDNPQWRLQCWNVQRGTTFEIFSRRVQTFIDGSSSLKHQWETDWIGQRSIANRMPCYWAILVPEVLWKTWYYPEKNRVSIKYWDRPCTCNYWWFVPSHQKRVSVWWVHKHTQIVSHFRKRTWPPLRIPQAICISSPWTDRPRLKHARFRWFQRIACCVRLRQYRGNGLSSKAKVSLVSHSYLCNRKLDPNLSGKDGWRPLEILVQIGLIDGVQFLLRHGKIDMKYNSERGSALHIAVR